MHNNSNKNLNQSTLAIHSTDNTYCFAYRENKNDQYDNIKDKPEIKKIKDMFDAQIDKDQIKQFKE